MFSYAVVTWYMLVCFCFFATFLLPLSAEGGFVGTESSGLVLLAMLWLVCLLVLCAVKSLCLVSYNSRRYTIYFPPEYLFNVGASHTLLHRSVDTSALIFPPGMRPGSHRWRSFRWQWTGPEVKLLLCSWRASMWDYASSFTELWTGLSL